MSMRSKAAILVEPNTPLVIDEVTFPDPEPDQVLVKLFASGICHSQLHQIHRTPQTAHRGTPAVFPSLLGHEATGVVVAKGCQVSHVQEGDHVMTTWVDRGAVEGAPPRPPVMVQWNSRAVPAGTATWTEYALLSERLVVPLDQEVATDVTSIIGCAVLTGCGVILNTLEVRVTESVAVFGVGGVGLCAVAAAHIAGAYPIIAVDLSDDKLAFAQRFGATHGVNAVSTTLMTPSVRRAPRSRSCTPPGRESLVSNKGARPAWWGRSKNSDVLMSRNCALPSAPTPGHAGACVARTAISPPSSGGINRGNST
jgi:Zn-dependent alcohol dehydrogenase